MTSSREIKKENRRTDALHEVVTCKARLADSGIHRSAFLDGDVVDTVTRKKVLGEHYRSVKDNFVYPTQVSQEFASLNVRD